MPKQLHISLKIVLGDNAWGVETAAIKPIYDQFVQALTAAGIEFMDESKSSQARPRKPKLESVETTAAPPVVA